MVAVAAGLRGLIVGYGSIGQRHAENLRRLVPDIDLLVLRRRASAAEPGVMVVRDLDEALQARPEFAVIASPSSRHNETLLPLLEKGIPCYVEKPIVTNRADLERLRTVWERRAERPVTLAGCNLRFLPSLRRLRELLQQGRVGRPVRASLQVGQWLPDWRPGRDYRSGYSADPRSGGGVIFDLIHEIDAARWLFGEFEDVKAIAGKFSRLEIGTEDTACILLGRKQSGPVAAIGLDYVARRRMRRYEIIGDEGTLMWDLYSRRLELTTLEHVEMIDSGDNGFDMAETYRTAMREFLDGVQRGRGTTQDLSEGLMSAELALRARESAGL